MHPEERARKAETDRKGKLVRGTTTLSVQCLENCIPPRSHLHPLEDEEEQRKGGTWVKQHHNKRSISGHGHTTIRMEAISGTAATVLNLEITPVLIFPGSDTHQEFGRDVSC